MEPLSSHDGDSRDRDSDLESPDLDPSRVVDESPAAAESAEVVASAERAAPSAARAFQRLVSERGVPKADVELNGFGAEDSSEADEESAPPPSSRNSVLEALVLVLLALVLALTLKTYVAEAYEIKGRSMAPTFANGERVVVLKVFYEVDHGDVVIFSSKEDPTKDLIKRVIGLPGDHIRIEKSRVTVNEELLDEGYINDPRFGQFDGREIDVTLGPNEYFVLGDNRDDSHDSRKFGPVRGEKLKGKVVVRWWPFHEVRTFF